MKKGLAPLIVISVAALLLLVSYVVYIKYSQSAAVTKLNRDLVPKPSPSGPREYRSDTMGFTMAIPEGFVVEEQFNSASVENKEGKIWITRSGTNFETFEAFWQDYKKDNVVFGEERSEKDGWNVVSYKVNERKVYLIFKESQFYTLSTEIVSLFDDLDQIAQSFRYTP